MARQENHASPDSLLGQLQRGRGEGYLRALSTPKVEARKLLVDCIINDARLDRQVENREEYYASIAMDVALDLAPLARHLWDNDDDNQTTGDACLTVETLGELAKRGYGNAADILCNYMEWGQWWDWPLYDLLTISDPEIAGRMAAAIERHFPSDNELAEALDWCYLGEEPWTTLAQYSKRIKDKLRDGVSPAIVEEQFAPNLTTKQILELAEQIDARSLYKLREIIGKVVTQSDVGLLMENVDVSRPSAAYVALAGLAHLAPEGIFGWLQEFWSATPNMKGFLRARASEVMVALPPHLTLPLAHEWLFNEDWHERYLAEALFKTHARKEDISTLRQAIHQALQDDCTNIYRLCNLAEAFLHLPDIGPVPELADVFVQFRYSYGRRFAAQAIHVTSPQHFREKFAMECLWDCEDEIRVLGARFAGLENEIVGARLQVLASNAHEDEKVREEAGKRLGSGM